MGVGLYTLIDNNQLISHRIAVYQAISRHLTVRDAKHQLPLVIHNPPGGGKAEEGVGRSSLPPNMDFSICLLKLLYLLFYSLTGLLLINGLGTPSLFP